MSISKRFLSLVLGISLVMISFAPPLAAQAALVTTVASAISQAFPSLATVFGKLFGSATTGDKPDAKQQQQQQALTATATNGQAAIKNITSELNTVALFLSNCTIAEKQVA